MERFSERSSCVFRFDGDMGYGGAGLKAEVMVEMGREGEGTWYGWTTEQTRQARRWRHWLEGTKLEADILTGYQLRQGERLEDVKIRGHGGVL